MMKHIPVLLLLLPLTSVSHAWFFGTTATDICDSLCRCPTDLHEAREKGLDCRDRDINSLPNKLTIPMEIAIVDFSRNHINEILQITFNPENKIKLLDFSDNDIEIIFDEVLMTVSNLETLVFKNNKLKDIQVKAFAGLLNLTSLDLSYNQLDDLPAGVFSELVQLEELILDYNPLLRLDMNLLANNSQLRSLSLSKVGIETLDANFFPENLRKLEKLSLAHNEIAIVPSKALHQLSGTLKELDLSGNPIQTLGAYSFYGLYNIRTLRLDQMLRLEAIDAFAFGDLIHLETCTLRYMPRIGAIDAKAFRTSKNKSEITIPVEDFTLSFSILSTLPEKLLHWATLRYVDIQYNHWDCDCDMKWIKNSSLLKTVGNRMICSKPSRLRGQRIINIPENEFTCESETEPIITRHQSAGFLLGLMIAGIGVSLGTIALLVYWRQGWLCHQPEIPYTNIERGPNTITVVDDMEWDNKDLQKD